MDAEGCTEEEVCEAGIHCDPADKSGSVHRYKMESTRDKEFLTCGLCDIMEAVQVFLRVSILTGLRVDGNVFGFGLICSCFFKWER